MLYRKELMFKIFEINRLIKIKYKKSYRNSRIHLVVPYYTISCQSQFRQNNFQELNSVLFVSLVLGSSWIFKELFSHFGHLQFKLNSTNFLDSSNVRDIVITLC